MACKHAFGWKPDQRPGATTPPRRVKIATTLVRNDSSDPATTLLPVAEIVVRSDALLARGLVRREQIAGRLGSIPRNGFDRSGIAALALHGVERSDGLRARRPRSNDWLTVRGGVRIGFELLSVGNRAAAGISRRKDTDRARRARPRHHDETNCQRRASERRSLPHCDFSLLRSAPPDQIGTA
jgi:hypothetical protein